MKTKIYLSLRQKAGKSCKFTLGVTAVLMVVAACCDYTPPEMMQAEKTTILETKTVDGITANALKTLLEENKGKVTIINFWATWCPPCVAEIPELQAFYKEHKDDNLAFLAVSLDSPDSIEKTVTPFVREKNISFPVYVLQERNLDVISKTVKQELAGVLPTTLVYAPNGKVHKMLEGGITKEDLESVVKPLLQ